MRRERGHRMFESASFCSPASEPTQAAGAWNRFSSSKSVYRLGVGYSLRLRCLPRVHVIRTKSSSQTIELTAVAVAHLVLVT